MLIQVRREDQEPPPPSYKETDLQRNIPTKRQKGIGAKQISAVPEKLGKVGGGRRRGKS